MAWWCGGVAAWRCGGDVTLWWWRGVLVVLWRGGVVAWHDGGMAAAWWQHENIWICSGFPSVNHFKAALCLLSGCL